MKIGAAGNLSANVVIPNSAREPIEVYIDHVALCIAIIEREGTKFLPSDWEVPGVYVLLDRMESEGRWGSYVGKAPAGIKTRLLHHLSNKDHWSRAVLIRRDTKYGFHSAQVGWLEGRLYDLLQAAENAHLHNKRRPVDETLPPHDRQMLESCVMPFMRVMRLIGYDPTPEAKTTPAVAATPSTTNTTNTTNKAAKRKINGTVQDLLNAGLVTAHTELVSLNGAWPAEAVVLPDGKIECAGRVFNTPSGAARHVKGGAANGWKFWAIETNTGQVSLDTLRARLNR